MRDAAFKELRLEKHRSLVERTARAVGAEVALAICDAEGAPVWSHGERDEDELARILGSLFDNGLEGDRSGAGIARCEVEGSDTLLVCELTHSGECHGRLALLVRESRRISEQAIETLGETLGDVAACIADEYALAREVHGLAGELSDRYEELNLFYSLDGSGIERGAEAVRTFLQGFAELVGVDIAAFVTLGERRPMYVANLSRPIDNLDLVLVAIRGDLFRFVRSTRRILVMNQADDPRRRFVLPHLPFKVMACPVGDEKVVERVLVLLRHVHQPDFSNSDRSLARVVAEQAGLMIHNRSMVERLHRFGEQTAGSLIEAVEAKDPYTRGHSERVQVISYELGRAYGMQGADLEDLYWGSIFHDVGKLGVPDAILSKPGRLTGDEYDFIKIHPERSYEILRHIEYLRKNALDGARHHHERFDGKGYPHELRGKTIPIHARIVAVADTYDAMTSSRSYRAARGHDEAMAEIRRVSGTQFDPEIVDVFEALCADGPPWPESVSLSDRDDA